MGEREKSNGTNEANEADEKEGHNFGNHPKFAVFQQTFEQVYSGNFAASRQ